jgi:putative ABC transport system permease protein
VIAAIVGLALLCGALFGIVPVWITFQADLSHSLTRQGNQPMKGFGRQRFQNAVVVLQIALAMFLTVGAGLMARGFQQLTRQDLGFRPQNLLTFRVDIRGVKFAEDPPVIQLVNQYLDRLAAVPGVERIEMANPTIPTDDWNGGYILYEDHRSDAPDGAYPQILHSVSPGYFDLLGIPLLRGRVFTRQDTQSFGVVVSKSLADEHWPGGNPIGKRLKIGGGSSAPWLTILGVVADVQYQGLLGEKQPAGDLYQSILQIPSRPLTMNFLVKPKAAGSLQGLEPALRREVKAISANLPAYDVRTMEERLSEQTARVRFQIVLVGLFTLLALVLASVGIYGVVAYSTAQRTREIAIRMSLGADRVKVLRMVVGRGALLAAAGLGLGLVAILLLSRRLVSLFYGVSATDPLVLGGTALTLFLVTLVANYIPARRAAKLDPVLGLHAD